MSNENRYLKQKGKCWHYQRRVPKRYENLDDRRMVECSLRTRSKEIARLRRDAIEESDNLYWASLSGLMSKGDPAELLSLYYQIQNPRIQGKILSLIRLLAT